MCTPSCKASIPLGIRCITSFFTQTSLFLKDDFGMTLQCSEAFLKAVLYMQLYFSTESHSALMKDSPLLQKYPYVFPFLMMVIFNGTDSVPLLREIPNLLPSRSRSFHGVHWDTNCKTAEVLLVGVLLFLTTDVGCKFPSLVFSVFFLVFHLLSWPQFFFFCSMISFDFF